MNSTGPTIKLRFRRIILFLFFAAVMGLIVTTETPTIESNRWPVLKKLFKSPTANIPPYGAEYLKFKTMTPPSKRMSFIMDYDFNPYVKNIERLYDAQAFLVPVVLNPRGREQYAIVNFTDNEIARTRLKEKGYRLAYQVEDGLGLAVKGS